MFCRWNVDNKISNNNGKGRARTGHIQSQVMLAHQRQTWNQVSPAHSAGRWLGREVRIRVQEWLFIRACYLGANDGGGRDERMCSLETIPLKSWILYWAPQKRLCVQESWAYADPTPPEKDPTSAEKNALVTWLMLLMFKWFWAKVKTPNKPSNGWHLWVLLHAPLATNLT